MWCGVCAQRKHGDQSLITSYEYILASTCNTQGTRGYELMEHDDWHLVINFQSIDGCL